MSKTQAQTTDLQLIEKTIGYYFDAMINHNVEPLKKAFHPTAPMKWIGDQYTEVNAIKALGDFLKSNTPVKVKTTILVIDVAGDAGSAKLELEFETFSYFDYMQLLKIDGEWKIVSKIYSEKIKEFKK